MQIVTGLKGTVARDFLPLVFTSNFIQITNVNEKPKLTKVEKEILRGMYWSRGFIDKIKLRLQRMRIGKENANLDKNFKNILNKSRARSRRRKQRKTRKL